MSRTIELSLHLHRVSVGALLVSDDAVVDNAVWIPRSCIVDDENYDTTGKVHTMEVQEWKAKELGLI
jgi:hypothetical protein